MRGTEKIEKKQRIKQKKMQILIFMQVGLDLFVAFEIPNIQLVKCDRNIFKLFCMRPNIKSIKL